MNPEQQRLALLIGAGIFGLIILISLGFLLYQTQQGKVIYSSVPHDLTLKLDGKEIPASGTIFVTPGKHEFVASRAAFTEKKTEFEIAKGETKTFELYIFPDDSAGLEWVKQNPEEAAALDGYFSQEYEKEAERVFNSYGILSQLPILDRDFRIDHGKSQKGNDFALYIQASTEEGRANALRTIEVMGYDPAKMEIIYTTP